ncbi:RHS repeat-associated core domain-containing protein [Stenotrophomonas sp.]|uniref:RHS repeat-associated core domain-containing protein n=1 Tax=Stenotrophomonas sp. TaxID=69392 RepID=UPI0028A1F00E|nr:RHS repeat-associated core domain-containing protein [Stenotrophomonas sp.]
MATHDNDDGSGTVALPQAYGYDALGLWVRSSRPDCTHWRYWRGGRLVNALRAANDGGGDVEVTWITDVAEQVAGPGARSTLLASAPGGSVLLEADTDVRSLAYAPQGHRDPTSARAAPGFNGEWLDAASGCYLLGPGHHRPYSPTLALFLAPDTASPFSAGGLNTLAYCAGDPINFADPSGHFLKWILAGVGIALGVVAVVASFGAASAAVGAIAAGGIAALTKSGAAAIAATTLGVLSVGAEVGAIAASEAGDEKTAGVLGWVGVGLGIVGAAPAIAKTAMRGATRFARFAQRATGSRSSATAMRGAAGGGRASRTAIMPAARSAASSSPTPSASSWYAAKAPHLGKSSRTFATYPVSNSAPRAGGRPAFRRQLAVDPDGSNAAGNNAILDGLVNANYQPAVEWTPPPLKQYPSPAYTTGHLAITGGAGRPVDVAGHVSAIEAIAAYEQAARRQDLVRRIGVHWKSLLDRPPGYDQATLPSYASLGFH